MDSAGIEQKGFLPVKAELDSISAIKNKTELLHEIAREYAVNHSPFFRFYVSADDRNSLINAAHFDQGGLGLPSRDYYFNKDSNAINIRNTYIAYITKVFTLLGQTSNAGRCNGQISFRSGNIHGESIQSAGCTARSDCQLS